MHEFSEDSAYLEEGSVRKVPGNVGPKCSLKGEERDSTACMALGSHNVPTSRLGQ